MNKLEIQKRVTKNNLPLDLNKFSWDEESRLFESAEDYLFIDFRDSSHIRLSIANGCTVYAGDRTEIGAGNLCFIQVEEGGYLECGHSSRIYGKNYLIINAGDASVIKVENDCTIDTGQRSRVNCKNSGLVRTGSNARIITGDDVTIAADIYSKIKTGDNCSITIGDKCEIRPGRNCDIKSSQDEAKYYPNKK